MAKEASFFVFHAGSPAAIERCRFDVSSTHSERTREESVRAEVLRRRRKEKKLCLRLFFPRRRVLPRRRAKLHFRPRRVLKLLYLCEITEQAKKKRKIGFGASFFLMRILQGRGIFEAIFSFSLSPSAIRSLSSSLPKKKDP